MAKHPSIDFLRPRIKDFIAKKGESLRWFAKQVHVDYQKLYRLEAQELRSLSFFEAGRILRLIEPVEYQAFLREFYPEEVKDFGSFSAFEADLEAKTEAIQLILASEHSYQLYLFIVESKDVSFSGVEKFYGLKGLELANLFIQKGALTITQNGDLIGILDGNNAVSDEDNKAICKRQVELVDFGLPGSFIGTHSRGLNQDGKTIVYKAIADLSHLIFSTMENPQYQGADIMVAGVYCGSATGDKQ